MLQSGGRIELGSGEVEAEFFEQVARGGVFWMMSGEKGVGGDRFETVGNDGACCLFGKALTPKFRAQVKTQLVNVFLEFVGTKSRAANVSTVGD